VCVKKRAGGKFHILKVNQLTLDIGTYCRAGYWYVTREDWFEILADWIEGNEAEFAYKGCVGIEDLCLNCSAAFTRATTKARQEAEEEGRLRRKDVRRKLDGITEVTYENMDETGITPGQFEEIFSKTRRK
jgi:hypothetical protein